MANSGDLVLYQFSRLKVQDGNFRHFLSRYGPDKLPTGRRQRVLMNSFVFCIEGWDDDERELHCIPEVRRFYSAFHEAWPYWLYFCNLDTDTLRMMTMCCLPTVTAIQVDGSPNVRVDYDPTELLRFLARDFVPMNAMCDRGGMREPDIEARTRSLFEYFNLPYQAE